MALFMLKRELVMPKKHFLLGEAGTAILTDSYNPNVTDRRSAVHGDRAG